MASAPSSGPDRITNGSWFRSLAVKHIRRHHQAAQRSSWETIYPGAGVEERAEARIRRACGRASLAGALASTGASAGEMISLFSDGLGAPIGVPAIALSMCGEALYTTVVQIDLACDLGSIYGVDFNVDDIGDLTTLFGLALELSEPARPEPSMTAPPVGLIERLLALEDGEVGRRIGRKLFEDSLMRNVVPIVGVAISARWNWVATRRLGGTVRRYVRYRRALCDTLSQLQLDTLAEPELLVEGAWLLATTESHTANETTMAIGIIVDALPEEARRHIGSDRAFGDDEEGWFDALRLVPRNMYGALMDVLFMVAAADRQLQPGKRRFLHRVGRAIGLDVDMERVETICQCLASGQQMPAGLL